MCRERVEEELGEGWERTLHSETKKPYTAAIKTAAFKMQRKVSEYVTRHMEWETVLRPFKGTAYQTLVYAQGLLPEARVTRMTMSRLDAEDEASILSTPTAEDDVQVGAELQYDGTTSRTSSLLHCLLGSPE